METNRNNEVNTMGTKIKVECGECGTWTKTHTTTKLSNYFVAAEEIEFNFVCRCGEHVNESSAFTIKYDW